MSPSPHPRNPGCKDARQAFAATVNDLRAILDALDDSHLEAVSQLAQDVRTAWRQGGKLLVCGNGGSAADSQHIVAELVGRFEIERKGRAAVALTVNPSTVTAVGNDYGFEAVFARQVEALGNPQDVLLVISTSGNSRNCIAAVVAGRAAGLRVHGFLGGDGGQLLPLLDGALVVPSSHTPRIQEIHITMGHLLCNLLDDPETEEA